MLALECPGDQAGKSSARAPPPAANLGRVERRRRRKWRIWQAAEEPHLHLYVADFAGDGSSCHCSVARRCLPGWPGTRDCASVATCGQGGHSGAGKGFPTHPPGGPAALPLAPTFSTRFFSAAFLSPPGGAGSGMSGSWLCLGLVRVLLGDTAPGALLLYSLRAGHRAWPGGQGHAALGVPGAEPVLPQPEAPTRLLQRLGRVHLNSLKTGLHFTLFKLDLATS